MRGTPPWARAVGWSILDIDLPYFNGCPSWDRAWAELGCALVQVGVSACVRLRDIADLTDADNAGFAGSPTIRIEGRDLEGYHGPARMARRRYLDNDGHGWPGQEALQEKLRAALAANA